MKLQMKMVSDCFFFFFIDAVIVFFKPFQLQCSFLALVHFAASDIKCATSNKEQECYKPNKITSISSLSSLATTQTTKTPAAAAAAAAGAATATTAAANAVFTCEGTISIRNQAPSSHYNSTARGVSWCNKTAFSNLNHKSSNASGGGNEYSLSSSQHRNACISISVGVDA